MSMPQAVRIESVDLSSEDIGRLIAEIMRELPDGWDRRKHPRIKAPGVVVILSVESGTGPQSLFVLAHNISRGGLGFRHTARLPAGTAVTGRILIRDQSLGMSGRVIRCRSVSDSNFEMGVRFDEEIRLPESIGARMAP